MEVLVRISGSDSHSKISALKIMILKIKSIRKKEKDNFQFSSHGGASHQWYAAQNFLITLSFLPA
jgi:hypothetical protein